MEANKDIFISYRNDGVGNNFATRIANDLRNSGYSVYFNPDETRSGNFPQRLKQAIIGCKDFICIVTDDYISQLISNNKVCWIRDELLYAKQYGKNIIPILINETQMPSDDSKLPEAVQFFPKIDAYDFPEQYINSPYELLCTNALISKNDGKNGFRDTYNSSTLFNPDKSLNEVLSRAQNGDVKAMLQAGIYYYYGISGGKDERKAAMWFKKVSATESECSSIADKFIARMYYAGSIPREEQSYEKSYEYHVRASKNDVYSAGQVGFMKSIGSGCAFDYQQIEDYYLSNLDHMDNPRKDTLCRFYIEHGEFVKAANIYKEMANTYPNAAYQLGLMYKRGVLSSPFMPDYTQAAMYFQMALDNGLTAAAYDLGTLYFNPTGTFKKDFKQAQKYYHIAADKGNVGAQYMLGYMYFYGHVEKNIPLAIMFFELAAEQGHVLSATNLALIYQMPGFHNYEKAFNYCKFAADCGDAPSEFVLGTLYLSGRGCDPDEDKAYLCFKHAAENGATEALIMLRQMEELGI
ncbi:MAG: toll/interleukin-1 receptor domain-containing protein [Clostridia bacterium]|nr:toll/interleukin-1 receptor domain-containing protein [Clostridia bacterium]